MDKLFFIIGSLFGGIGVILGAFAAHGLKGKLDKEMFDVFEVGVRYHMYHALLLLAVAWAVSRWPSALIMWSGWLFVFGLVIFSGSLYLLSLSGMKWLGAITPVGGGMFIAGWFLLAYSVWKYSG